MVSIIGLSAMAALVLTFAAGRWSAPDHIVTKTVTVEKKTEDDVKHEKTTTVEVKQPNGTDTTTTVTTDDTEDKERDDTSISQTKETSKSSSKLTIAALAGVNVTSPGTMIYGGSVSRGLIGPISIGVFGLSNGVGGASIGLSF
jgi:hypothetical protein